MYENRIFKGKYMKTIEVTDEQYEFLKEAPVKRH